MHQLLRWDWRNNLLCKREWWVRWGWRGCWVSGLSKSRGDSDWRSAWEDNSGINNRDHIPSYRTRTMFPPSSIHFHELYQHWYSPRVRVWLSRRIGNIWTLNMPKMSLVVSSLLFPSAADGGIVTCGSESSPHNLSESVGSCAVPRADNTFCDVATWRIWKHDEWGKTLELAQF